MEKRSQPPRKHQVNFCLNDAELKILDEVCWRYSDYNWRGLSRAQLFRKMLYALAHLDDTVRWNNDYIHAKIQEMEKPAKIKADSKPRGQRIGIPKEP